MKIDLEKLKEKQQQGVKITFDLIDSPRIPDAVLYNGSVAGQVTRSTVNSFKKWLESK